MPSLNKYYTQYLNDLGSQYKAQMDTETQNYNASKKNLDSSYNRSAGQLGTVREQAMRDAYVSQQKAMRDMPVTLAAQGIRGGMTESTYGNLLKTYQNSRNAATTSYNQQYGDLTQNYQNNMTELENAYRKSISDIKAAQNADAWARANDSWAAYLQEQAEKRAGAVGYGKTEEDGKKLWGRQVIGQFQIKFSGNAKVSWKKNITHWTNSVSMVRRKDYLFS